MKKITIAVITAVLSLMLCIPTYATEDTAVAEKNGYHSVPFKIGNDTYIGYCVDKEMDWAEEGETFTVVPTSYITNNNSEENIADYLKVLFTDHFDDVFKLVNGDCVLEEDHSKYNVIAYVWAFSDSSDDMDEIRTANNWNDSIPKKVLETREAYNETIPDTRVVKKVYEIAEDDKQHGVNNITFNFVALKAGEPKTDSELKTQDFFAYKKDEDKSKEDHNYNDWEVTKEPTELEPGEKERVCEDCDHKDIEVLPLISSEPEPEDPTDPTEPTDPTDPTDPTEPTEPTDQTESTEQPTEPIDSAKTGDDTNVTMWFILMALAGIAGTVIYRKRSDA